MKLLRHLALGLSPALVVLAACDSEGSPENTADLAVSEASASELDTPAEAADKAEAEPAPAGEEAEVAAPESEPPATRRNLLLPGPTLAGWKPTFYDKAPLESPPEGYSHLAIITGREVGLFRDARDKWPKGLARTGARLPARPVSGLPGCSGGSWYEVSGGAYLCSAHGVHVTEEPVTPELVASLFEDEARAARRPATFQPNMFRHGKAKDGAPFLRRLPNEAELEALRAGESPGDIVNLRANGPYVLALTREVEAHGERFFQTIYGSYIRADDVEDRPLSPMHGEWLDGADRLPLAFSWRKSEIFCLEDSGDFEACGTVAKHARFRSRGTAEHGGQEFILIGDGLGVPREDLRIAQSIDKPSAMGDSDKWMHIDLTEQVLIAYEGARPVFATLISSGDEGFHTPTGTYRVYRQYISKTMQGKEPDGRPYQVQEVPWAMYYDGNYAAHGAYWHNNFGKPQSHGCVNIPPLDARWLYHWGDIELPEGWHSSEGIAGTRIHITGKTPIIEEESA